MPTPEEELETARQATTAAETRATTAEEALRAANEASPNSEQLQNDLNESRARNIELERTTLQAANPDLPEAAFAGDTPETIRATVDAARAVADHLTSDAAATANRNAAAIAAAGGAGGTRRTPEPLPKEVRGSARIAHGLGDPQSKYTPK